MKKMKLKKVALLVLFFVISATPSYANGGQEIGQDIEPPPAAPIDNTVGVLLVSALALAMYSYNKKPSKQY